MKFILGFLIVCIFFLSDLLADNRFADSGTSEIGGNISIYSSINLPNHNSYTTVDISPYFNYFIEKKLYFGFELKLSGTFCPKFFHTIGANPGLKVGYVFRRDKKTIPFVSLGYAFGLEKDIGDNIVNMDYAYMHDIPLDLGLKIPLFEHVALNIAYQASFRFLFMIEDSEKTKYNYFKQKINLGFSVLIF